MRALTTTMVALTLLGCSDVPPGGARCDDATLEVCQVFVIVNEERSAAGLDAYTWSPELALSAQRHAEDMVSQGYFDHVSLDGRSFSDRTVAAGYLGAPRGENIAQGQTSAEQVMQAWMGSDGHRGNILSDGSNEIGVGFLSNTWVQVFGRLTAE